MKNEGEQERWRRLNVNVHEIKNYVRFKSRDEPIIISL